MAEHAFPVQWAGRQAVMTLPEHIDASNVSQIRGQLLALVNQGAAVLIADMTGTASCDHGGADALARAYQRAAVTGTQLRLVVTAPVVRRVLAVNGLDRLISIYPSLQAALAAGTPRGDLVGLTRADAAGGPGLSGRDLLDRVISNLYQIGLSLLTATSPPHELTRQQITDAVRRLDETIRDIGDYLATASGQSRGPKRDRPSGTVLSREPDWLGRAMEDVHTFSGEEIITLARAIDAATDRGDDDEAIRLSSLSWAEARHWLDAHGYSQHRDED